jgi:tetratricopeptide (TPR) repeat protein
MEIDALSQYTELENVLASRCFRDRKALQTFLRYVVSQTLAGNAAAITQYRIAVEGLGKASDFDANHDPLIRIQAGRLRKQLEEYYATEGRFNPLRISLPVGSYQPVFSRSTPLAAALQHEPAPSTSHGPNIICIPRLFVADESSGWPFITRLTREYVNALIRFNFCQVMFANDETHQAASPEQVDFALFFDLHNADIGYSLKCSLVQRQTRQIIWAESFTIGNHYPAPPLLNAIFKRIANDSVSLGRGLAHDVWARQLLDAGKPIADHHQVMIAVRQQLWDLSAVNFRNLRLVCEQRLAQFPHDVQATIIYADLCRSEYLLKYREFESLKTHWARVADTLMQLAPGNAHSHLYAAGAYLLEEEYELCLEALAKAQAINALDTHLNTISGLMHLGMGDWQTGAQLIQDSVDISPIYPDWYHIPLCIFHYREGRYLTARQEAKKIRLKHFWGPMLRTALYQRNDLWGKADTEYQQLAQTYPDFIQTGINLSQGFTSKANQVIGKVWANIPDDPKKPTDR